MIMPNPDSLSNISNFYMGQLFPLNNLGASGHLSVNMDVSRCLSFLTNIRNNFTPENFQFQVLAHRPLKQSFSPFDRKFVLR